MRKCAICPFCQEVLADRRQEFCASCHRRVKEEGKAEKKWTLTIALLAISGVIISIILGQIADSRSLEGYLPATCTVTDRNLYFHRENAPEYGDKIYYSLAFTYTVSAPPNQRATARGYSGPVETHFNDSTSRENAMEQFSVGGTYPCWYPRGHIEKAVLLLNREASNSWTLSALGFFAFPSAGLAIMLLLMLPGYTQAPLLAQGTVIRRIQVQKKIQVVVAFPLATNPELQCTVIIAKDLPPESPVEIAYSPHNPTDASLAQGSPVPMKLFFLFVSLFVILPVVYLVVTILSLRLVN